MLFLEVSISFLEKRTLIELCTQLLLTTIKLILMVSGKELPLGLILYIRFLLSIRDLCQSFKLTAFVKAFVLYLAMSLFYERTGHRDSFFEVNLMDPSLGQEYPNLYGTYSLFVFIGQYSV
jgi:hypothetical protein